MSAFPGFGAALCVSGPVEDAAESLPSPGLPGTQSQPGDGVPGGDAEPSADAPESKQWDMHQIRTEEVHAIPAGSPSFFADNNEFRHPTEFRCSSDPGQRAFGRVVERALPYAPSQDVTPVAALGDSDQDLAHPVDEDGQPIANECGGRPGRDPGRHRVDLARTPVGEGPVLRLRRRPGRRGSSGRQRHDG